MKGSIYITIFCSVLFVSGCLHFSKMEMTSGRNANVCKKLTGEALLYVIYVNTRAGGNWGEFDMINRQDALGKAIDWIHDNAMDNDIDLQIRSAYCNDTSFPIKKDFHKRSLTDFLRTVPQEDVVSKLNRWSNYIAKQIGVKNKISGIKNLESLVTHLRNQNHVDNLGVIFMTNNYYKSESSIAINTNSNSLVEFAIIGNNDPVSIAHELLHLFGSVDFYRYPYGKQYWENKDIEFLKSEFPTSIMHLPSDKDPKNFTIDPFTKYCIGWTDSLETKYDGLNKGKTKMTQKIFKDH
ncbi:MAG TPA: hypothetical protein EYQ86_03590 [Bacteroidetes bacterium]|nr:hypothetical protein [Bacteroidota bacterium]